MEFSMGNCGLSNVLIVVRLQSLKFQSSSSSSPLAELLLQKRLFQDVGAHKTVLTVACPNRDPECGRC